MADDLISRQQAIGEAERWLYDGDDKRTIGEMLRDLPSVQPEIINCKDCKNSRFFDPCFYCYEMGGEVIVPENGFCFKAERRE